MLDLMTSLRLLKAFVSTRPSHYGRSCYSAASRRGFSTIFERQNKNVVILDGVRTPFTYQGSEFANSESYELAGHTIMGAIERNKVKPDDIDLCVFGQAFQNPGCLNVARDAIIYSGLDQIPAHTVSNYEASAFSAMLSAYARIKSGNSKMALVGGVELFSGIPVLAGEAKRKILQKYKSDKDLLLFLSQIFQHPMKYFLQIEVPEIKNPISKKSPLLEVEYFASRFKDLVVFKNNLATYVYSSLLNAEICRNKCFMDLIPVHTQEKEVTKDEFDFEMQVEEMYCYDDNQHLDQENLIKIQEPSERDEVGEQNVYNPANAVYLPRFGDGAACTIITEESTALSKSLTPKAFIRDIAWASSNAIYNVFDSSVLSMGILLSRNSLCIEDISVLEISENSGVEGVYTKKVLENSQDVKHSTPDMPRRYKSVTNMDGVINDWGGTMAFGNPFGASGIRMINMACNRLQAIPNGRYAVVSTNSHGALGCSILLEKYI